MQHASALAEQIGPGFRPLRLVLVVLVMMLLVSLAGNWYAERVSLLRYCQDPELALQHLAAVITENRPAGEGAHRDYMVSAKLEFLVPRTADEPLEEYLQRLRLRLEQQCR